MRIELEDWLLEVDTAKTAAYSMEEYAGRCTCGYCRNYYAAVDPAYPHIRGFMEQFGIHIEAPDELMPYEVNGDMWCDGLFAVSGRILRKGRGSIHLDQLRISFEELSEVSVNHGFQGECFVICVSGMILPWVLDEPMEEINSPVKSRSLFDRFFSGFEFPDTDAQIIS